MRKGNTYNGGFRLINLKDYYWLQNHRHETLKDIGHPIYGHTFCFNGFPEVIIKPTRKFW